MNRGLLLATTVLNAIGAVGLQLLTMLFLDPTDYGWFSAPYLLAAFFLSIQLSVVSESWVRTSLKDKEADWTDYGSTSVYLSLFAGTAATILCLCVSSLRPYWYLVFIASSTTVYRSSARFYSLRMKEWSYVIWADVAGALLTIAAIPIFIWLRPISLETVFIAWAIISLVTALCSRLPLMKGPSVIVRWIRHHRNSIPPLLRDSLIMDASSIGTPYLLIPVMGIADFGVYRGVSNVSAPVRLLLNPLRPTLTSMSKSRLASIRTLAAVIFASAIIATIAAGCLIFIGVTGLSLGTLSALTPYAIPVGIFVLGSFLGHSYYLIARQYADPKSMLLARVIQTTLSVVLPIAGAVTLGLSGAIWGFAIATLCSAVAWIVAARSSLLRAS